MKFWALLLFYWLSALGAFAHHQHCGSQAGGALCAGGQCCSKFGFCGNTPAHCTDGCQSQCTFSGWPSPSPSTLSTPTPIPTGGGGEKCGSQAEGALCAGGLCCSKFGFCGSTPEYCTDGCQSQCTSGDSPSPSPLPSTPTPSTPIPTPTGGGGDNSSLVTQALFNQMLKNRNDASCQGHGFYTYDSFIAAAKSFEAFGTTGDADTRKREIAAFLAQTSHETAGGWASAPDGPYAWGYCYVQEQGDPGDYCVASNEWPCATGKEYYGRGPFQISYNYNYGQAGKAINYDLLNNPDAVATDPTISFKTALWFWMTSQSPKPSCHDVITGNWTPSTNDTAAGRVPGYGVITNIINGGEECGNGSNPKMEDRIGFYNRYCDILGVTYGANLDCYIQSPFA